MKSIEQTDPTTGEIILYRHDPSAGDFLTEAQLFRILPYVQYATAAEDGPMILLPIISIQGNFYLDCSKVAFDDRKTIILGCNKHLAEKVLVPQHMPGGGTIKHKPLFFGYDQENARIAIKYSRDFGEFNDFNAAIKELQTIYPSVRIQPEPLVQARRQETPSAASSPNIIKEMHNCSIV